MVTEDGRCDQRDEEELRSAQSRMEEFLKESAERLEASKIAEYVELLSRPSRLIYLNIVSGIARGLGFAVGATVLAAILLYFLQRIMVLNLPVIGGFVAEIVRIVQEEIRR